MCELLEQIAAGVPVAATEELEAAARRASAEPRQPQARPAPGRAVPPWRPLQLRWMVSAVAAILVTTGLGFGIGQWLTPSGSARSEPIGLGFLPAKGWTVVQSGPAGPAESARAIAANVRLYPADPEQGQPLAALQWWPSWGIVIDATLTVRGDTAVDAGFPVRTVPLHFGDAVSTTPTEYQLRAGVGGYNVDAAIAFGGEPTPRMLREAEEQIARLVVAPAQVTMAVRPTVYARDPLIVYGSVSSGTEGERVTVQFKQCGLYPIQFRDVVEVSTEAGGGWSTQLGIAANGTLRAVSGKDVSNEVRVKARADVRLSPRRGGKLRVDVVARSSFWRRKVELQRQSRGAWVKLRTMVLEDAGAAPGSAFVWSSTEPFRPGVPRGTPVRAVLPLDQAKPCFIAGYSNVVRA